MLVAGGADSPASRTRCPQMLVTRLPKLDL
jgi:hypothetical protein